MTYSILWINININTKNTLIIHCKIFELVKVLVNQN